MKLRQKKQKQATLQYGIGIALVVLVMTTSFLYLISLSMKPYQDARVEGENQQAVCRIGTGRSGWFLQWSRVYYSVLGHNKSKRPLPYWLKRMTTRFMFISLIKGFLKTRHDDFEGKKELATLTRLLLVVIRTSRFGKSSQEISTIWSTLKQEQWSNKEGIWNYPNVY